jgi:hypothetical protein
LRLHTWDKEFHLVDLLEEVENGINREEVRALVEEEGMLYQVTFIKQLRNIKYREIIFKTRL